MFVHSLELENFRNYETLSLNFDSETTVFFGANAQGKTNILEALYLCSCARSHRTGRDRELIRWGCDSYQVQIQFQRENEAEEKLRIIYREENLQKPNQDDDTSSNRGGDQKNFREASLFLGKKEPFKERKIFHNGFQLDKLSDLFGLFQTVIFAPEDLMIVKGSPAVRRRFIDILISQVSRSYFRDLQRYQQILRQRNLLLKKAREHSGKGKKDSIAQQLELVSMDTWNQELAVCGARLVKKRYEILSQIQEEAQKSLQCLSDGSEEIQVIYHGPSGLNPEEDEKTVQNAFYNRLCQTTQEDILKGSSSQGPHRDDFDLLVNQRLAKVDASQGQQRSIVLALKMAELALIETATEESPVLLLDDVLSELDQKRRNGLFEAIQGRQVFMTCTDPEVADWSHSGQVKRVKIQQAQVHLSD